MVLCVLGNIPDGMRSVHVFYFAKNEIMNVNSQNEYVYENKFCRLKKIVYICMVKNYKM